MPSVCLSVCLSVCGCLVKQLRMMVYVLAVRFSFEDSTVGDVCDAEHPNQDSTMRMTNGFIPTKTQTGRSIYSKYSINAHDCRPLSLSLSLWVYPDG